MAKRGQLNHLSAAVAAERIAAGSLTSVAPVEACLARIAERENQIHAWAFVDSELALAQARARDGEHPRGVLHGIPIGIKDVIDTEDMPTEYGSTLYAGHRPAIDGGRFDGLWTHLHVPRVTIPAFEGPNGMPVGLQLVAAHGGDESLPAAAGWIAQRLARAAGKLPIRLS